MKLPVVAAFCRRMGIGLRAGVDILRLLENETKVGSAQHQRVMAEVRAEITKGSSLSRSMLKHKKYFPPLLIQMTNASELGGRMDEIFLYMADYYDELKATRTFFVQRITWPTIQLFMAIGIVGLVILLQGILSPNSTYDASGIGLRGTEGFVRYITVVGTFFSVVGLFGWGIWKNWFNCHGFLVPIIARIPTLGTALVTLAMSRLSNTLSMLLNAGVEAKRSVKQAFLSTGNHYYIAGMELAVSQIEKGATFGDAFEASSVLPKDFIEQVRIGELSGTETESLDHLAGQYMERAKSALNTIANIASFTIWIGVMLIIAFLIIRMAMQYIGLLNDAVNGTF